MRFVLPVLACVACMALSFPSHADEMADAVDPGGTEITLQEHDDARPAMLSVGGGAFGIEDPEDRKAMVALEYRFGWRGWDIVAPMIGGFVTPAGGAYIWGGFGLEIPFLDTGFILIPSTAVGAYNEGEDGEGRDLGSVLEFRSGLELIYEFDSHHQIGVGYHHISNASTGDRNPGVETLILRVGFPFL